MKCCISIQIFKAHVVNKKLILNKLEFFSPILKLLEGKVRKKNSG